MNGGFIVRNSAAFLFGAKLPFFPDNKRQQEEAQTTGNG